jgi:uncharacterized protein YjbJ (UPF0337 family)
VWVRITILLNGAGSGIRRADECSDAHAGLDQGDPRQTTPQPTGYASPRDPNAAKENEIMKNPMVLAGAAMISIVLLSSSSGAQGTTDKIEGTAKEVQGTVKETVGQATGDTKLEWGGKADKAEGAAQKTVGDVKNTASNINGKAANLVTRVGDFFARMF